MNFWFWGKVFVLSTCCVLGSGGIFGGIIYMPSLGGGLVLVSGIIILLVALIELFNICDPPQEPREIVSLVPQQHNAV